MKSYLHVFFFESEYEQKLIADVVQPQGARIKPPEELMNSLAKACENLQVQIIGSILIASAKEANFWISRVVTIFILHRYFYLFLKIWKLIK